MAENPSWEYRGFPFYVPVPNPDEWLPCPDCGEVPRIWEFDNGRQAICLCLGPGGSRYIGRRQVILPGILQHLDKETGQLLDYDHDGLRKAWNQMISGLPTP